VNATGNTDKLETGAMALLDSPHDETPVGAPSTNRRSPRAAAQPHRWDQASVEALARLARGARLYCARPERRSTPRQQERAHHD
jgi:hypothetical protein